MKFHLRLFIWIAAVNVCQLFMLIPAALAQEADLQTQEIVAAADVFLNSLNEMQQGNVLFGFSDTTQRSRWSNFPEGLYDRTGLRWNDLTITQRENLTKLLGTLLSPKGLQMVQEQMAADDILAQDGGGGRISFGSGFYYVSFLGVPSTERPWMFQFGGHHLAINATVSGPNVTIAPSLTGGQPTMFEMNGEQIYIVEDEVEHATNLLNSLRADQLELAVRSSGITELVLGPGNDEGSIEHVGLRGEQMDEMQKSLFRDLIASRLDILNADDFTAKMQSIGENLDTTYFAWFGPTTTPESAYWRVTGPTVTIEFAPQSMGGDPANHLHNMYREPGNDYGIDWLSVD